MCGGHKGHRGGWHQGPGCGCGCHGGHRHGGSCGCGGGQTHFGRRFWTKEEKVAWLEQYLADLQAEAQAVEEHIAAMKGEK